MLMAEAKQVRTHARTVLVVVMTHHGLVSHRVWPLVF